MRRRVLLASVSGAAAWPSLVAGQGKIRRVAILLSSAEDDPEGQARIAGIRQGLKELGWIEGKTIQLDVRFGAGNAQRMKSYATDLVAAAPDVIVVNSTPVLDEVARATRTIPVVFVLAVDPVALGHIQSFARPGGNITGFTFWDVTLMGKWLQLLKESAPAVEHAVVVHDTEVTPFYPQMIDAAKRLPNLPPVSLSVAPIHGVKDIERAVGEIARRPNSAVIAPSDPFLTRYRAEVAAALLAARLPSLAIFKIFAEAGWLMSYGPDTSDVFKRSAGYIDRILKGANPGDLPAQAPTIYQFTVNASSARKLGLAMPPNVLAAADQVIE